MLITFPSLRYFRALPLLLPAFKLVTASIQTRTAHARADTVLSMSRLVDLPWPTLLPHAALGQLYSRRQESSRYCTSRPISVSRVGPIWYNASGHCLQSRFICGIVMTMSYLHLHFRHLQASSSSFTPVVRPIYLSVRVDCDAVSFPWVVLGCR